MVYYNIVYVLFLLFFWCLCMIWREVRGNRGISDIMLEGYEMQRLLSLKRYRQYNKDT